MQIFWCRTDPWLASPAAARRFCEAAGIGTEDFLHDEELVSHAAGRYLLLQGGRQYWGPMPELVQPPGGKPRFSGGRPGFSISHAGRVAVCGFGQGEIGVDVEEVVPVDPALWAILRPEERAYLERAPEDRRMAVFFQLWTGKESLVKARGGVLADLLEQESLITAEGRWKERVDGFLLRRLPFPAAGYELAVAMKEEEPITLVRLELPEDSTGTGGRGC